MFPNGLRRSLHGFGGHLQVGQQFQLLAAMPERGLLTDHRLHAAHSGREFRIFDFVQAYPAATVQERQQIMDYFPAGFLPGLHSLAQDFTVCDRWYSLVPGPTWPNRFFALSGASQGGTEI